MENKNKIINQNNLLFLPGFIIPPLNEKFNLFENNNIIHYNNEKVFNPYARGNDFCCLHKFK
jgi:hypothetical protein